MGGETFQIGSCKLKIKCFEAGCLDRFGMLQVPKSSLWGLPCFELENKPTSSPDTSKRVETNHFRLETPGVKLKQSLSRAKHFEFKNLCGEMNQEEQLLHQTKMEIKGCSKKGGESLH